ncbi:MAG: response regulator transcription factor [Gammaproteobacteria bacterium]|jgi:DNA-binding response OmpR family regulator
MNKILIIDDDTRLCRLLTRYLEKSGYTVAAVHDAENMRTVLASFQPAMVILDLSLPDSHGLEITKELRDFDANLGILILTGSADDIDQIVGLEIGADDYVKKPVPERELLARTRSLMRRVGNLRSIAVDNKGNRQVSDDAELPRVVRYGSIEFDGDTYQATTVSGKPIALTTHEFRLLFTLAEAKSRVLNRDQLIEALYGRAHDPLDRSVDVLIAKIRKKLKASGLENVIVTIRGAGYKYNQHTPAA